MEEDRQNGNSLGRVLLNIGYCCFLLAITPGSISISQKMLQPANMLTGQLLSLPPSPTCIDFCFLLPKHNNFICIEPNCLGVYFLHLVTCTQFIFSLWFPSFPVRGSRPGKNVQLTENEIRGLCLKSREIFLSQPILLELEAPLKICGTIDKKHFF